MQLNKNQVQCLCQIWLQIRTEEVLEAARNTELKNKVKDLESQVGQFKMAILTLLSHKKEKIDKTLEALD